MLIFDSKAPTKADLDFRDLNSAEGLFNRSQLSKRDYLDQKKIFLAIQKERRKLKLLTAGSGVLGLATAFVLGLPLGLDPAILIPVLLLSGGGMGASVGKLIAPGALFEFRKATSRKDQLFREFLDSQQALSGIWAERSVRDMDKDPYILMPRVDSPSSSS